jgi:type II secretion system protein G
MSRNAYNTGFTLIELLVVIAIIGLLASIVLASLTSARAKARDAVRIAQMEQIRNALELYAASNNGSYPNPGWGWRSQCAGWGTYTQDQVAPGLVPTYIAQFPTDPGMVAASNVNCYLYLSNGTDYKVLDYVQSSDVNTAGERNFIDPLRNSGRSWQILGQCLSNGTPGNGNGNGDGNSTWAIWSSSNSMCW